MQVLAKSPMVSPLMILRKYAQMKNWTIYDIYIDDGWSGANFDWPGFKRMIEDIEAGHTDVAAVKDSPGCETLIS